MRLVARLPKGIRSWRVFDATAPLLDLEKARRVMETARDGKDKMQIAQGCLSLARRLVAREPQKNSNGSVKYAINGSLARNLFLLAATSEGSQNAVDFVRPINNINILLLSQRLIDRIGKFHDHTTNRVFYSPLSVGVPTKEELTALTQAAKSTRVPEITIGYGSDALNDSCVIQGEGFEFHVIAPWILLINHISEGILASQNQEQAASELSILLNLMVEKFGYPDTLKAIAMYREVLDREVTMRYPNQLLEKLLRDVTTVRAVS